MPKIYQYADIVLLPSKRTNTWEEQYGMVFVEAMASGLPIVTYDTGTITEIISSEVIKEEGDIDGLANSLINLIKDKKARLKLGTMGRVRAEKFFDSKKSATEIKNLYISLCKR